MAQLALGVAGAVVGNIIAPGIGGAIGFALGSAAGSYLFPEKFRGPGLSDNRVAGSSYGLSIPIVYSSGRAAGNVIDRPREYTAVEHTEGGKGGPEITTTTAKIDYLQLLLSQSDGDVTIGRVYANKQLVDDYREGSEFSEHLPLVFYNGADDQLPDPTLEAVHGVGTISAYRGFATVVMTDLGLERWGNTLASFEFEVFRRVFTPGVEGAVRVVLGVDGAEAYAWPLEDTADPPGHPLHPAIMSFPRSGAGDIRIRVRNSPVVHTYSSSTLLHIGTEDAGDDDYFPADHINGISAGQKAFPIGVYVYTDSSTTPLWTRNGSRIIGTGNIGPQITSSVYFGPTMIGTNWAESAGLPIGEQLTAVALSQNGKIALAITTDAVDFTWHRIVDGEVTSSGACDGDIANGAFGCSITNLLQGFAISLENNGRYLWLFSSFDQQCTVYKIGDDDVLRLDAVATALDLPPGSNGAVSVGSIATLSREGYAGVVFDDSLYLLTRLDSEATSRDMLLSEVAADICERARLTSLQYDVSDIPIPVRSYMLDQMPVTGRAALETILPCYLVRTVDSAGVIKFVRAGKASLITIPDIDLATHLDDEALPAKLQIVRGSDENIPAQIIFEYVDINADYQIGAQASPKRMVGTSNGITVVKVPVGFTGAEAKRVVETWARFAIDNRDPATCYVSRKYIEYEGTDVVTVQGIDWWIAAKSEGARGVIKLDLRRSRPTSLAEAGVAGSSGIQEQELLDPQDTELEIIDAPYIVDEFRQAVIQVGMQGEERRPWRGAVLMKSTDGGASYTAILSNTVPDTMGETVTALANFGGGNQFDYSSSVEVEVGPGGGELSSATEDAVLAGANECMIGAEVLQYVDAELIAPKRYRLHSGLLRGRRGSEWAMRGHAMTDDSPATGERFISLPTKTTIDAIYADYGLTRQYKAPTIGRTLATADAVDFRSNGVSVAPYSPVHLMLGFNGAGEVLMEWVRRARIHGTWLDWVDVPLDEATEAYLVTVWEDGSYQTVLNTYPATSPAFTYTVAQQTTDFGGALTALPAVSVAQIGRLGPGYDTLGRLPDFVPVTVPGFVPPNPPPADAILSTITWASSAQVFSGAFDPNRQWIISVPVGNVSSTPGDRPSLTAVEFGGPPSSRVWTASLIAGDFAPQEKRYAYNLEGSNTVNLVFCTGTDTDPDYPTFPLNTTFYLNIKCLPTGHSDVPMVCNLANVP